VQTDRQVCCLRSFGNLRRSAHWRYAKRYDDYPETGHLSEQQSRSHWSYKRDNTRKGSFFDSVVIMSSSSEEDVVVAYMFLQRRRQKRIRCWVHPYNVRNIKHSSAVVSRELSQHENKCRELYRMSPDSFWREWFQHSCRIRIQISDSLFHQLRNYSLQ
jgi:hypothetical protein